MTNREQEDFIGLAWWGHTWISLSIANEANAMRNFSYSMQVSMRKMYKNVIFFVMFSMLEICVSYLYV